MRLSFRNLYHILFQIVPNIFYPQKLYRNLRHPIHEWVHTRHEQTPIDGNPRIHIVKHYFFGKIVTVDLLRETDGRQGDYYGHCEYFPQTFNLIERIYVNSNNFQKFMDQQGFEP